jgi:hypothetical protein
VIAAVYKEDASGAVDALVTAGTDLYEAVSTSTKQPPSQVKFNVAAVVAAASLNAAALQFNLINATGAFDEAASVDKTKIMMASKDFDEFITTYASKVPDELAA